MYIINNVTYNNSQMIPTHGTGGVISDGEGIIVDDNSNDQTNNLKHVGTTLVENNVSYANGGPGILDYDSSNVDVLYNTTYHNETSGIHPFDVYTDDAKNAIIENNIAARPLPVALSAVQEAPISMKTIILLTEVHYRQAGLTTSMLIRYL